MLVKERVIIVIIIHNDLNFFLQISYIPCCREDGKLSSCILISFERININTLLGDLLQIVFLVANKNILYVHNGLHPHSL